MTLARRSDVDKVIAEKLLTMALKCSRIMDESVAVAKERRLEDREMSLCGRGAGKIMASLFQNIIAPICDEHPGLAPEWYTKMNDRALTTKNRRGSE
jgi:hypothetical protein